MKQGSISSEHALQKLFEGNHRFFSSHPEHPRQDGARRSEIIAQQEPFAAIFTCADSRVSPEIIFDQGLGDLFVVRVAGNIINDHVLGSLEYASYHLNTPLIVVMGHTHCGMITAVAKNKELDSNIASLAPLIEPHVDNIREDDGELVYNATVEVTRQIAKQIGESGPILAKKVEEGTLQVLPAMYDISTGRVSLL